MSTQGPQGPQWQGPPGPPPQYAPGPPPKKRRVWLWVVLGVVALFLVGCVAVVIGAGTAVNEAVENAESAASSPAESAPTESAPAVDQGLGSADASADVVLGEGAADEFGLVQVPLTVTNNSEKRSDYFITVAANGPDGTRLDETLVSVLGLEPGQGAAETATFFKTDLPEGLTFVVLEVQRTASV